MFLAGKPASSVISFVYRRYELCRASIQFRMIFMSSTSSSDHLSPDKVYHLYHRSTVVSV